jgi:hypothetical protein
VVAFTILAVPLLACCLRAESDAARSANLAVRSEFDVNESCAQVAPDGIVVRLRRTAHHGSVSTSADAVTKRPAATRSPASGALKAGARVTRASASVPRP